MDEQFLREANIQRVRDKIGMPLDFGFLRRRMMEFLAGNDQPGMALIAPGRYCDEMNAEFCRWLMAQSRKQKISLREERGPAPKQELKSALYARIAAGYSAPRGSREESECDTVAAGMQAPYFLGAERYDGNFDWQLEALEKASDISGQMQTRAAPPKSTFDVILADSVARAAGRPVAANLHAGPRASFDSDAELFRDVTLGREIEAVPMGGALFKPGRRTWR